ncbi:MAG: trehalose-phosphatase [Dehalococcoidia bacterium]
MAAGYLFDRLDMVEHILSHSSVGLISDVDGTLAPIVDSPAEANLSPLCREALRRLVPSMELVALVSGRSVEKMLEMVQVEGIRYVGNHGLQWWAHGKAHILEEAAPFRQAIGQLVAILRKPLIQGLYVEDKGITLALHYRNAADPAQTRAAVLKRLKAPAKALGLRVTEGKMLVEARPPIEVNKGTALASLARDFSLNGALFLGDDITDVDAFRAMHSLVAQGKLLGLAIAVLDKETPPQVAQEADLTLQGVRDVERFLDWLVEALGRNGARRPAGPQANSDTRLTRRQGQ